MSSIPVTIYIALILDGWMDGQMDKQMDGWTDESIDEEQKENATKPHNFPVKLMK